MPEVPGNILVGQNGQAYVAPLGTAEPANVASSLDAAFVELGIISEDGAKPVDSKETVDIPGWQSFYTYRTIVTKRDFRVGFVMREWKRETFALAFGGGTFVDQGGGMTKYEPPSPETIDERVFVLDWQDGDANYRLVIPRCQVVEAVETQLARTVAADLPVTLAVLAPATGALPWYPLTDAEQFAS